MTGCPACGYDPANVTARYELLVATVATADNGRTVNQGATRWAYKARRKEWAWAIAAAIGAARAQGAPIPLASARRRLIVTRIYADRQRALDGDNIATFYKAAVDELVAFKLLVNDSPKWVDGPYYRQERGEVARTRFVLEEVAWP